MLHQYISYVYIDYLFYSNLLNLLYKILTFFVIENEENKNTASKYQFIDSITHIATKNYQNAMGGSAIIFSFGILALVFYNA